MSAGPGHFAVLSAIVFAIGLFGVIAHNNVLRSTLAVGVLFTAPLIALVGFAQAGLGGTEPPVGDAFALLSLLAIIGEVVAAAALASLVWRRTGSADVDETAAEEII